MVCAKIEKHVIENQVTKKAGLIVTEFCQILNYLEFTYFPPQFPDEGNWQSPTEWLYYI